MKVYSLPCLKKKIENNSKSKKEYKYKNNKKN